MKRFAPTAILTLAALALLAVRLWRAARRCLNWDGDGEGGSRYSYLLPPELDTSAAAGRPSGEKGELGTVVYIMVWDEDEPRPTK